MATVIAAARIGRVVPEKTGELSGAWPRAGPAVRQRLQERLFRHGAEEGAAGGGGRHDLAPQRRPHHRHASGRNNDRAGMAVAVLEDARIQKAVEGTLAELRRLTFRPVEALARLRRHAPRDAGAAEGYRTRHHPFSPASHLHTAPENEFPTVLFP